MDEMIKVISDVGLLAGILIILFVFVFKYGGRFIEMWLKRAEEKNAMIDSLKTTIEVTNRALDNNSKVIENNSIVIKQNTDNRKKWEENLKGLRDDFKQHDFRAEGMASDLKIIKERKV